MPILNIKDLIEKVRLKVCSGLVEDQTFIAELCVLCDFATEAAAKLPTLRGEITELRASVVDWKKCADLAESALASEQQCNAELVVALREEKRSHPEDFQQGDFRERALARHAAGEPVKHPDTERHVLAKALNDALETMVRMAPGCEFEGFRTRNRYAIDAARKQGGAQ